MQSPSSNPLPAVKKRRNKSICVPVLASVTSKFKILGWGTSIINQIIKASI